MAILEALNASQAPAGPTTDYQAHLKRELIDSRAKPGERSGGHLFRLKCDIVDKVQVIASVTIAQSIVLRSEG